jgi:hypothetical protein
MDGWELKSSLGNIASAQGDMATYDAGKISAVLVCLDIIGVYLYCISIRGVYPPSHPWSGFALLLLSIGMIRGARNRERSNPSISSRVYVAWSRCRRASGPSAQLSVDSRTASVHWSLGQERRLMAESRLPQVPLRGGGNQSSLGDRWPPSCRACALRR